MSDILIPMKMNLHDKIIVSGPANQERGGCLVSNSNGGIARQLMSRLDTTEKSFHLAFPEELPDIFSM